MPQKLHLTQTPDYGLQEDVPAPPGRRRAGAPHSPALAVQSAAAYRAAGEANIVTFVSRYIASDFFVLGAVAAMLFCTFWLFTLSCA